MKKIPSLFPLSKVSKQPFKVNPYDALHRVDLLGLYYKALQAGKGVLVSKNPHASTSIALKCGGYGRGAPVRLGQAPPWRQIALRLWMNTISVSFERGRIVHRSDIERSLWSSCHRIGSDFDKENWQGKHRQRQILPPREMHSAQRQILMRRCVGEQFLQYCVIYKPTDMDSTSLSSGKDVVW